MKLVKIIILILKCFLAEHVLPKKQAEFIGNVAVMGEEESTSQVKKELPSKIEATHETTIGKIQL